MAFGQIPLSHSKLKFLECAPPLQLKERHYQLAVSYVPLHVPVPIATFIKSEWKPYNGSTIVQTISMICGHP